MMRRGLALGRRLATFGAAAVLALSLAGDRGRAATVPATVYGQDPLEVLELKVRPNVIVVLDSSGSMTNIAPETFNTNSGDHPRSKLYQAKKVLQQLIQLNQDKVSFQLGTYTQYNISMNNRAAGNNRFHYVVDARDAAFMDTAATELTVQGALGDSLGRGLQSWQIIYPQWGTLHFEEDAATDAVCTATLTGLPKFYTRGGPSTTVGSLAAELQTAMNAAACTGSARANTYNVAYNTGSGVFTFSRASGSRNFRIVWGRSPNNIRNALAETSTATTAWTTSIDTDAPYTLLYRTTGTGSSGTGLNTRWRFTETIDGANVNFYQLRAGRFWNGEVVRVNPSGEICGMDFASAATKTNPPSLTVQEASAACVAGTNTAKFVYGGGDFGGNNRSCNGFRSKSDLIPCDLQSPPAPLQVTQTLPYIDTELPFSATGDPADWNGDGSADYVEALDGGWAVQTVNVAPSAKADGSTPIANSLIDIKGDANNGDTSCILNARPTGTGTDLYDLNSVAGTTGACVKRGFRKLWEDGQTGTTVMAGPPPWEISPISEHGVCPDGTAGAGATCPPNERKPKEKTIVLFVTDGDDTCTSRPTTTTASSGDGAARRAAYYAQQLYTRIDATDPASSVQTYVIGFGGAFTGGEPYRLNWIAWGGSGLGQGLPGQPAVNWPSDSTTTLTNARAQCTTCEDAFVAPDAPTLARQLQAIIDQGASDGDFNAQQSITESVFEYVDTAQDTSGNFAFDPDSPSSRYGAIVPTRFVSSFSLPGFHGQLKAYQNDGSGNSIERWSAGDKLTLSVSTAMASCNTGAAGGAANECVFDQLHGGVTDVDIATSTARIKRRIYTTDRNGVYAFTPSSLIAAGTGTAPANRVALWPPASGLAPTDYVSPGSLDAAIGLPADTPTAFPPGSPDPLCDAAAPDVPKKSFDQCWLEALKRSFKACLGTNLPAQCTGGGTNAQMLAARREARDIILAFMAGATPRLEGAGIARTTAAFSTAPARSILFKARPWLLADSELATAAVVTPPSLSEPTATAFVPEYVYYRDGVRNTLGKNPDTAGTQIRQGFGLTKPDDDQTTGPGVADARANLKPVMTVIYAPANDMLHAFRAGPSCSSRTPPACAETGGEELWGFVPYDQLNVLYLRPANEPQGRSNHVFMMSRGIRFADVFVPGALTNQDVGGVTVASLQGVWRRVLYFGRGIAGKYVTALDVTGPGPYTAQALETVGPIPLWNRGNPDTTTGLASGANNGSAADRAAYATMGQTWSMPTVAFVNPTNTNAVYNTTRYPNGVNFVLFMGSGYGDTGEGTTHYTLDALSGDVIAAVDVETTAASYGLTRTTLPYANALVANSVSFNRSTFAGVAASQFNVNPHPWSQYSARVYVGDLHGRMWKFLTESPDVAIPAADLGVDQPIGTAVALLAEKTDAGVLIPNIFVSSGNERRAAGPFRNFALRDEGSDTDTTTTGTVLDDGVTTYTPVVKNFARTFDQGDPEADCGYSIEAVFRGTIQPTSSVECDAPLTGSKCDGNLLQRVFFGGTRLSLPNTKYAPITPLSCGSGVYPCRSQFDSILYALGVQTGLAAYDLNASGDDAYRIYRDSRIAAISLLADPDPGRGGSRFTADEGLIKGTPKPPPPPGVPPTATTATANVIFQREPGQPAPAIRYGTTVCQ